jgi:hypothetical protein
MFSMELQKWVLNIFAIFLGLSCLSCHKESNELPERQGEVLMPWSESLNSSKSIILTGSWDRAESAWAKLNKENYSRTELAAWIQLQVEILEATRRDKLKSGLRKSAMQQLYWFPEESKAYLEWLKQGLATNLFIENDTENKAREIVARLEHRRDPTSHETSQGP